MKHRFFLKLLISFLAAGLLPAVLLAGTVGFFLVDSLQSILRDQAQTALERLTLDFENELGRIEAVIDTVIASPEIAALPITEHPDAGLLSSLSRRLAEVRRDDEGLEVHVAAADWAFYATSAAFPREHRPDRYAAWGLLRRASQAPGETVFFPTRIQQGGEVVVLSAARRLSLPGHELWVIADLSRERLYRRAGLAGQTLFQEVLLVTNRGTIVFDLRDPGREDSGWRHAFPTQFETVTSKDGLRFTRPVAENQFAWEATLALDQFGVMTSFLQTGSLLAAGLSLLVSLGLAWALSRSVSRPVSQLVGSMARVEAGDFSPRLVSRRHDELGEAFHRFNVMVDRLIGLIEQTKEEQRLLRISESRALQAQINPHFLYNTLNSIKALATQHQADDIRTLVVRLGKLLRSTINNRAETETVAQCLDLLKLYLDIENLRFGGRFTFLIDVDPVLLSLPIPRLLLQPLVENALVHGLESKRGPGTVTLTGRVDGDVRFVVTDDGVGMAPARQEELRRTLTGGDPGRHVGLHNVHRRLVLLFGEGAGLTLDSVEGQGTRVTLTWPGGPSC